jgi:hypothetical protein
MQPFDGDVYDKRYETVFAPGIMDAGLEPYRVDRDPGVSVPIDSIESGIKGAQLCFAEITTDNPNVWFELGFAIAASKDVVLVCSEDRKTHFPFDVQHRSIIKYRAGAPQDFVELRDRITKRIKALLEKQGEIVRASAISPVKNTEGLSQHEIVALVTVMQNQFVIGGPVTTLAIRRDMNQAGFTDIAVSLAVKLLRSKNMLMMMDAEDERGERYSGFVVTKDGEAWLLSNQDRLVLKQDVDRLPF